MATGLCHSNDHLRRGGYPEIWLSIIGGHEGAGVVEAVGPGGRRIRLGDHAVLSVPLPPCGDCAPCLDGRPYFRERERRHPLRGGRGGTDAWGQSGPSAWPVSLARQPERYRGRLPGRRRRRAARRR
ncbi:alcohol dehydrogenase catalytic domain-containing protein [Frankia sp. CiP3]|uniref:alcohol dehydrogenase catalytic domain-containing protein n=1 Tax=Frankia sp. CiP3 TaxID=2880971 RepID=UPI001EF712D2|nr:alcohol dehydrogenase catalytic domain-containing protein [Frankia sp. CiP3]